MTTGFLSRCLIGLALGSSLFAQGVKPPPAGGASNGSRNGTTPTNTTTNAPISTPDLTPRPLFLAGKVIMEDGTAPPESVVIQLVCRSSPRSIGRTDSKGSFSIDLNNRAAMMTMADASENASPSSSGGPAGPSTNGFSSAVATATGNAAPRGVGDRDLMGCDLQAAFPGYRSEILHLSNRRSLDDPNVGTLILNRIANVEGTTISITTAMAPKDAKKAFDKALNALKKDKWEDAQKQLTKAVEIYPKFAVAWVELGRTQEHAKDVDGAAKSYANAIQADPKLIPPYLSLATTAFYEQKWQEVAEQTDRILKLNPLDFPQAYLLNCMSNFYLRKLDAAEKSAREGLTHDPEHHFPKYTKSWAPS
jgi:hypothetical protein